MPQSLTVEHPFPPAWRRVAAGFLILVLLSGAVFRLAEYVRDRSLWLDEAVLARNLQQLPAADLALGRLTDDQVAPPGFLLTVKAVTRLLGDGEPVLRLLPFIAGLGFLILFGAQAWRRLGPFGALAAAMLLAWSWPLIYYANEFKPYGTDALLAFLFFIWAQPIEPREFTRRRAGCVAIAGLAALWFSLPAVFLLAAWGLREIFSARRRHSRAESTRWAIVGVVWVLGLAAQLGASYHATLGNPRLFDYHQQTFLSIWPPAAAVASAQSGLVDAWALATSAATGWLWCAFLLAGAWAGWRRHRGETVFIAVVVALTALASLLHLYPCTLRLLLFSFPLLFWLVGRGVDFVAAIPRPWVTPVLAVALAIGICPLARDGLAEARIPIAREDLRPVVAELARRAQPGDAIAVFDFTRYAFDYYWPRVTHADVPVYDVIFDQDAPADSATLETKVAPVFTGHPARLWLVATHYEVGAGQDNLRGVVAALRRRYPRAADFVPIGGTAQGVVFFAPATPPAPMP